MKRFLIASVVFFGLISAAIPAGQKVSPVEVKDCNPEFVQKVDTSGLITCAPAITTFANPTAVAGPVAINGSATTAMRSDAAPAVQLGTAAQKGIVQVDGTTITATGGIITAAAGLGVSPGNPTATAGPSAINGSASTYMRSDGAPAVQLGSSSQAGLLQCGSGTSCSAGTISVTGGAASYAAIGWIAANNPDTAPVFTASTATTITDIRGKVITPVGATAAISLLKSATGNTCPGGTNLISGAGTFDANGTANTNQSLTLAGGGAPSLSAGDTVCLSTSNGANFSVGAGIGGITITYTIP